MSYALKLAESAQRQMEELPLHVQKRVARWLDLLKEDPFRSPSRQLEGHSGLRRVHASRDYVIIYSVLEREVLVLVVRVGHRREIYRRL